MISTATGVGATVKHFPGLGCVTKNTDTDADVVDDSTTTASTRLQPFTAGIAAGARAVMAGEWRRSPRPWVHAWSVVRCWY